MTRADVPVLAGEPVWVTVRATAKLADMTDPDRRDRIQAMAAHIADVDADILDGLARHNQVKAIGADVADKHRGLLDRLAEGPPDASRSD